MLTFTKKVLRAYRTYGFEPLFIIGPQGSGKTTYALLVLYEVYKSWDRVLEYTFFDLPSAMNYFEEALETGERIPVILFDDAGIHLSKYLWFSNEGRALVMWFNALYNLIRSITAAVIFTSPDMDTMVEIRKKSWWIGEPRVAKNYLSMERQMVLYRKRITVTGKVIATKRAIDVYRLDSIPDAVRAEYEKKRKEALKKTLAMLREALEKWGAHIHSPPPSLKKVMDAAAGDSP